MASKRTAREAGLPSLSDASAAKMTADALRKRAMAAPGYDYDAWLAHWASVDSGLAERRSAHRRAIEQSRMDRERRVAQAAGAGAGAGAGMGAAGAGAVAPVGAWAPGVDSWLLVQRLEWIHEKSYIIDLYENSFFDNEDDNVHFAARVYTNMVRFSGKEVANQILTFVLLLKVAGSDEYNAGMTEVVITGGDYPLSQFKVF